MTTMNNRTLNSEMDALNIGTMAAVGPEAMKRTLVLCTTYQGLPPEGEASLSRLREAGATVVRLNGMSCITQARNYLAAEALRVMALRRDREPYWWVLQLDADVVVLPEDIYALQHYAMLLTPSIQSRRVEMRTTDGTTETVWRDFLITLSGREVEVTADPLLYAPLVSAAYVGRLNRSHLAAILLDDHPPRLVREWESGFEVDWGATLLDRAATARDTVAVPALTGLGCALQSAPAYWDQIANAPAASASDQPDGRMPVAFQTLALKRTKSIDTELDESSPELATFLSEDIFYSRTAWLRDRGAYVVPVAVGHVCSSPVYPSLETFERLRDGATGSGSNPQTEPPSAPARGTQQ
jgi:hypothetical protein